MIGRWIVANVYALKMSRAAYTQNDLGLFELAFAKGIDWHDLFIFLFIR